MSTSGDVRRPNRPRPGLIRGLGRVLSAWLLSRVVIILVALKYPIMYSDVDYYWRNAHTRSLLSGMPEYPLPIAVALMLPARELTKLEYRVVFVLVIAVVDLMLTVVLWRRVGRRAARFWIAFVMLVGPIGYLRFDLLVAACVTGVLLWGSRRPWLSGLAAATGSAIKLWPLVLGAGLEGSVRRRLQHAAAAAVGVAVWVGTTVRLAGWDRVVSPLKWQSGRGFEFETPVSAVLGVLRVSGDSTIRFRKRHGSQEYVGPLARELLPVVHLIEYAGFALVIVLLLLTLRRPPPGLALRRAAVTATALIGTLILTSPVLSPQYLLWLAPGLAVGAVVGAPRLLAPLALVAALLTQVEFPFTYRLLFRNPTWDVLPAWVILIRDVVLIALVAVAVASVVSGREARLRGPGDPRPSAGQAGPSPGHRTGHRG